VKSALRRALLCAAFVATPFGGASAEHLDPSSRVQIRVHGDIGEHCAMGAPGTVDFGDLNRPGLAVDVPVQFNCNIPFNIRIQAAHGALTNVRNPAGEGPYAGALPYTFGLTVPVRKPTQSVVSRNFDSRTLVGAQNVSSGGGIALDGMLLHVALGRPAAEAGLLAGDYSETIVITVSPS
jgi:spore coat protein U-like protein